MSSHTTRLDVTFSDPNLPSSEADEVIVSGTSVCYDLARPACYDGGTPNDTDPVLDLTTNSRDATIGLASGALAFTGNGIDHQNGPDTGAGGIKIPASVMAQHFSGNQYFLVCAWIKIPLLANWATDGTTRTFLDTAGASHFGTSAAFVALGMTNGGLVAGRRLTASFELLQINAASLTNFYGTVCQIGYYRTAAGQVLRLKNSLGTASVSLAVGAANATDFSTSYGWFGLPEAATLHPQSLRKKFTTYRLFMENLETSGRTPATVLDNDYTVTVNRGVFT